MEALWNLVLLVNRQIWSLRQRVKDLLLFSWSGRQDAKPPIVKDFKAGKVDQIQVFVEDDLIHLRSLLDGGHAMVRGDDDV